MDFNFNQFDYNLLLAPPSWGKTSLVLDLYGSQSRHIVFVSPLRAIANEFATRAENLKHTFLLKTSSDKDKYLKYLMSAPQEGKSLLITTPEMMDFEFFELYDQKNINPIIVFDEIHLFFYWGESFRPCLWDLIEGVLINGYSVLSMSATVDQFLILKLKEYTSSKSYKFNLIDKGNQRLRTKPDMFIHQKSIQVYKSFLFILLQKKSLKKENKQCLLYFTKTRSSAFQMYRRLKSKGLDVLVCVGGKVNEFQDQLSFENPPDCIISTSALSHGVNLPPIESVFIDYEVNNKDFWIQMVGRGGRNGASFDIHVLENFLLNRVNILKRKVFTQFFYLKLLLKQGMIF